MDDSKSVLVHEKLFDLTITFLYENVILNRWYYGFSFCFVLQTQKSWLIMKGVTKEDPCWQTAMVIFNDFSSVKVWNVFQYDRNGIGGRGDVTKQWKKTPLNFFEDSRNWENVRVYLVWLVQFTRKGGALYFDYVLTAYEYFMSTDLLY